MLDGNKFGKTYQIVSEMRESGDLKILIDAGLVSWKILFFHDIVTHYDILLRQGYGKMDAMAICEEKFGGKGALCDNTIYGALKSMEYDYRSFNTNKRGRKNKV